MADTTPIPAGALKLAKRLEKAARNAGANADHFATIRADDAREAARLLAGPARPDGVPDAARAVIESWWQRAIDLSSSDRATGRVLFGCAEELADAIGVPVPPYQPAPDPEALLVEKVAADWSTPDPADSPTAAPVCGAESEDGGCVCKFNAGHDGWHKCGDHNQFFHQVENDVAPPVAAGERTGPLGLSELDTRTWARKKIGSSADYYLRSDNALIEACRAAVAEWDAEPQPAETLDDIVTDRRKLAAWKADALILLAQWEQVWEAAGRPGLLGSSKAASVREWIEAASQPDPDTITVNLPRATAEWVVRRTRGNSHPQTSILSTATRAALAAAGLPQEPTATRPRPTLEEQRAHLDEGSCRCHDSWDQCPCAEGGHPADGSCGCCPLGTGLCGPLPQEPTEGDEQ